MTPDDLEERLEQLGKNWPIPSAADGILTRISAEPSPERLPLWRRQSALVAAALAVVAAAGLWFFLLATPQTLHAQVRQALEKAGTAHVVISGLDEQGVRRQVDVWYARNQGFRVESPEEIIFDNGKQQWSWRPQAEEQERIIARRPSQDAVAMITDMFHLGGAPVDWNRQRATAHDRVFAGRPCKGFVVTPPAPLVASPDGATLIPDPHPPRFVVLVDPDERIVHLEEQRELSGQWQARRQISIAYDVKVPEEKFAAQLPRGKVIDADRALTERFPVAEAKAQTTAGGLLFTVHDIQRGADDAFLVVSSVRGTDAYLRTNPPRRRRLNLQTVMLDVAIQPSGSVDHDCHRVALASGQADGVQYLWWLAVRRQFYTIEQGKRKPVSAANSLEVRPGIIRVPLGANYMNQDGGPYVSASVEVAVPVKAAQPIAELAARVRRDVALLRQAPGAPVGLYRWTGTALTYASAEELTDRAFADLVRGQLEWLRSFDKIEGGTMGGLPDGMPGQKGDK